MAAENASVTVPATNPSTTSSSSTPQTEAAAPPQAPQPKSPKERALEALRQSVKPAEAAAEPETKQPEPAKPPEPSKEAAEREQLDKAFRALNKREAELRQLADKRKTEDADYEAYKKLKTRAKLDPKGWLAAGGIDFDQVVLAAAARDGKPPNLEVLEAKERIAALEKKIEEDSKAREAEKTAAQKRAGEEFVAGYKSTLASKAAADADKYDLISAHGQSAIDLALEVADKWAIDHKVVPKHEDVLDLVEQYLYDEQEKLLASSKKLKNKISAPQGDTPQVGTGKAAPASPKKPPTLTNELQGNAPAREAVNPRKLTGSDRVKWALQSVRRS